ncbi:MAG: efflux RND transporter periplasmic adaptor subunit [Kofleriaceae bacterium]|nr:efflux RND transporter periplasmic adaptor subunit [Myxococcales bacterium]MCB9559447.1 efflux RND transporter periplasmic adaptor subunit [Kofleriaceae bacterium]MCB9574256.1 efflux RND transporter periplasmic adaptor subunit [Kofleriaceae bacterium]
MQLANRPRFRTDLVAECIEAEGQRFIDVIDPDTGDGFRFYEVEYSIACAMDGERDLAGLVQWAKEELGIEPSPAEIESVISTLGHLGYLDSEPVAQAAAEIARRREAADEIGLTAGVHAAPRTPAPPAGVDVELGGSGATAGPAEELPAAAAVELGDSGGAGYAAMNVAHEAVDDVELGAPGGAAEPTAMPSLRRQTVPSAADYSDEPTNLPAPATGDFDDEVSVDLSEHLAIRPDDVKEAVRMSRSMRAVEVPQDLMDQLEGQEADTTARAEAAKQAALDAVRQVEQADQAEIVVEAGEPTPPPQEVPALPSLADRAAVELPAQPVSVTGKEHVATRSRGDTVKTDPAKAKEAAKAADAAAAAADDSPHARPINPPQPDTGTSPILIVLFILVLLAGGAFLVWKYVLDRPKADDSQPSSSGQVEGTGATAGTATKPTPPPPPPPPPSAVLEAAPAVAADVTSEIAGVVYSVVDEGAEVQAGDTLVTFTGAAALQKKLGDEHGGLVWDIEVRVPKQLEGYQKALDKAQQAGNTAEVKRQQAKIDERTKRLDEKKAEADKLREKIAAFAVAAPSAGKVVAPIAKGKRVAVGDVVAQLEGPPMLTATFDKVPADKGYAVDATVKVSTKGNPEQAAECTVTDVAAPAVTVLCPADAGLAEGTEVELR